MGNINDINDWLYATLYLTIDAITYELVERLNDEGLIKFLNDSRYNFHAYISFSENYFNNFLDNFTLHEYKDKYEILEVLIKYLKDHKNKLIKE